MATLHGQPIGLGDEVWHSLHGFGQVNTVNNALGQIGVCFESYTNMVGNPIKILFFYDGRMLKTNDNPSLFWKPISKEAIDEAKIKPKKKVKKWKWVTLAYGSYVVTSLYYSTKQEAESVLGETSVILQKVDSTEIEVDE